MALVLGLGTVTEPPAAQDAPLDIKSRAVKINGAAVRYTAPAYSLSILEVPLP